MLQFSCSRHWDQPFKIMCDASDYAIGAILGQRIEKHFRPIHYASKTMTQAEANYTTTEKEMLAVVYDLRVSRSYLIRTRVLFNGPLCFEKYSSTRRRQSKIVRWVLLLQKFDFKRYRFTKGDDILGNKDKSNITKKKSKKAGHGNQKRFKKKHKDFKSRSQEKSSRSNKSVKKRQ
ncbi:reverse transcriptase domain-containing protein [Tanacetum coccineum]